MFRRIWCHHQLKTWTQGVWQNRWHHLFRGVLALWENCGAHKLLLLIYYNSYCMANMIASNHLTFSNFGCHILILGKWNLEERKKEQTGELKKFNSKLQPKYDPLGLFDQKVCEVFMPTCRKGGTSRHCRNARLMLEKKISNLLLNQKLVIQSGWVSEASSMEPAKEYWMRIEIQLEAKQIYL